MPFWPLLVDLLLVLLLLWFYTVSICVPVLLGSLFVVILQPLLLYGVVPSIFSLCVSGVHVALVYLVWWRLVLAFWPTVPLVSVLRVGLPQGILGP